MDYKMLYNEEYYRTSCGELPYTDPRWFPFFESVADFIIKNIHPTNVLDIGCAMGHLVKALRDRGVEAYGIDVSEYAISQVHESIKGFCSEASALDPLPESFPQRYDLVVTIEVAEHLYEEDAKAFIESLCRYGDDILFSSTSTDFTEKTHYNVRQSEYWAKLFAQYDFYRDLSIALFAISPDAMRFTRRNYLLPRLIEDYERVIRIQKTESLQQVQSLSSQLQQRQGEVNRLNEELSQTHQEIKCLNGELSQSHQEIKCLNGELSQTHQEIKCLNGELSQSRQDLEAGKEATREVEGRLQQCRIEIDRLVCESDALNSQINHYRSELATKDRELEVIQDQLNLILYSRGYRLLQKYYIIRSILLPRGSKRFYLTKLFFNLPQYIARGYIGKSLRHIRKHGFKGMKCKIKSVLKGGGPAVSVSGRVDAWEPLSGLVPPVRLREPVPRHTESVDIIICVHNAFEDVKRCIESVFEYTAEPFYIIIVDDGSGEQTKDYLASLAEDCPNIKLTRNEQSSGYTRAANIGLMASSSEYCVLLNSDTIVTEGWLDKMIKCQKNSDNIGIVGPLSNTASWQSVPEVFDVKGDWAHNKLPDDIGLERFGELIEDGSEQVYPQLPLLNGFCMMLHRSVIDALGYLDEENFGSGFGEEDDYNLRANKAGFHLALADDTFIFHAQSKSYTDEKRLALSSTNGEKLRKKHGNALLDASIHIVKDNYVLEGIRARVRIMGERERLMKSAKERWEGKRVLFLLPIADAGGGGNVIIQEARMMMHMGIDVWLYNLQILKSFFEASYPNLGIPVLYGNNIDSFREFANGFDAVCSTLYSTVEYCDFSELSGNTRAIYYVQDFEPYFFEKESVEYKIALRSYTVLPDVTLVTKTEWNRSIVERKTDALVKIIGKSVDIDLYRPRRMFSNKDKTVIAAMIRPSSPRRSPGLTLEILNKIARKFGEKVSIFVFGSDPEQSAVDKAFWDSNSKEPQIVNLGKLNKYEMVSLLSYADVFADFSSFQAMGLTAMEAMACGCCVIVPENGGSTEFVINDQNGIVVDTMDKKACEQALCRLIEDYDYLYKLSYHAIRDACEYYPEKCAYQFLEACFG